MIDTKLLTQLRNVTGAGIADCKEALEEADNDIDQAVAILRKRGAIKANKKSDRDTNEGVIAQSLADHKVATVALASETDFAARDEEFIKTVNEFSKELLESTVDDFKKSAEAKIKDELTVKIGENLVLRVAEIVEGEVIGTYIHSNKKVAAVIALSSGSQELANDLAMQITAMSPRYIKPEDIPADEIDKEKDIYREQLKSEGKPAEMWEKIIPGKLSKFYQEVCLLNQTFIKDDKKKVQDIINESGDNIEVVKFSRYQI
ncbi:MAG: elongation factor Ts [Parcubacteria group bacterium]|nr:elongation factor Ts [Parcubacteria group bacterium]|tara:strand:- start:1358 stop:2140 length:783 start_codon:yes stop_codon:yes gene_type:complete